VFVKSSLAPGLSFGRELFRRRDEDFDAPATEEDERDEPAVVLSIDVDLRDKAVVVPFGIVVVANKGLVRSGNIY
jgi:hypothetical protein